VSSWGEGLNIDRLLDGRVLREENILRIKATYGTGYVMNVRLHSNLFIVPVRAA
jgi:hypothetical protein